VTDLDEFKSYYALGDKLMGTTDQLADCLRILALHLGDHRLRFGAIPGQDFFAPARDNISDSQARPLKEGMEVLAGYLASVRDGWEEEDASVH